MIDQNFLAGMRFVFTSPLLTICSENKGTFTEGKGKERNEF